MEHVVKSRRHRIDRLSSLPDPLLHRIMSFLTTLQCVTLCVLSKCWKNIWTTLPYLNFNEMEFRNDPEEKRFREFVTMTLLLRDFSSGLCAFRLSSHNLSSMFYSSIRPWITYAINSNPRVLYISLELDNALPSCLFTCQLLEDLSIAINWADELIASTPEFVSLPNLRRLKLRGIELDDKFLEMLFDDCPLLEDLDLDDCKLEFSTLSSATLKHLQIIYEHYASEAEEDTVIERINTPSLVSFSIDSCEDKLKDGVLVNMPSLEHAKLQLTTPYSFGHMGTLGKGLPTCPEFSNLRDLSMTLCLSCHFNLVGSFLYHSPNLKKLTLHHKNDYYYCWEKLGLQGNNGWHKPIRISTFQCRQLSSVQIIYKKYDDDFHEVTKSLLDGIKGYSNVQIIIRAEKTR